MKWAYLIVIITIVCISGVVIGRKYFSGRKEKG